MTNLKTKVRKYAKKQIRRAGVALKKRYVAKKGGLNVAQIAKDVMTLKKVINSELKRTDVLVNGFHQESVGQLNGLSSGHHIQDISPSYIVQGNDYNQRSGNSIKLKSCMISGQFIQQASCNQKVRVAVEVWMRKQDNVGTAAAISQLYTDNRFVTGGSGPVYDLNSTRNPDYYNDYVLIRRKYVTVISDTVAPQNHQIANVKLPISFNRGKGQHCRWAIDGTYTDKQILIVARADCGNKSLSTSGTSIGVSTNATATGLFFNYQVQYFYYDN